MAIIASEDSHVLERMAERYRNLDPKRYENLDLMGVLNRVVASLTTQAPDDWRFTQSFTARFFVIDFESEVKILGLTYREAGKDIVDEIDQSIENKCAQELGRKLKLYAEKYVDGLLNPDTRIVHDLRTAYPKEKGEIGEEKKAFLGARESMAHVVPLKAKKLAARPNVIVMSSSELWVRQYMNWVNLRESNMEYLLFEQLTPKGINRARQKIFAYYQSGNIKKARLKKCKMAEECNYQAVEHMIVPAGFRTETYWVLPTCLDVALLDLNYRNLHPEEAEPLNNDEIVKLHFLQKIVEEAKSKLLK